MTGNNKPSKESKLVFEVRIDNGKLDLNIGSGISFQQLCYALKVLELTIENNIIALQQKSEDKKPIIQTPVSIIDKLRKRS